MSLGRISVSKGLAVVDGLVRRLAAGGSDTFTVRLPATAAKTFKGTIKIASDDPDENPFDIAVVGRFTKSKSVVFATSGRVKAAGGTGSAGGGSRGAAPRRGAGGARIAGGRTLRGGCSSVGRGRRIGVVLEMQAIFDCSAEFDPAGDLETFLKSVPARWAVYLFADEADAPVQLLCVRNLRASLKRRLGGDEDGHWAVEAGQLPGVGAADSLAAGSIARLRRIGCISKRRGGWFPGSYQGMVGFRPAWFIHVNPEAEFPRYTKTIDLMQQAGVLIGPIADKHAAARLIQLVEDAFELCRYYAILIQAPHGKACAYKEMGKCPAPCDGSISMQEYHRMVAASARAIVEPGAGDGGGVAADARGGGELAV